MDWRSGLFAALVLLPLTVNAQTALKTHKPAHPTAAGVRSIAARRAAVPFRTSGRKTVPGLAPVSGKSTGATASRARRTATAGSRGPGRSGRSYTRVRKAAAPSYQLHPDPERYQQIQQTLADRGFYKGQADGSWNDDSVKALQDFQTANQLDADGKINALTLMKLGLGPKHDGTGAPLSGVDGLRSATKSEAASPPAEPSPSSEAPLPPPPTSLPTDAPTTPE